MSGTGGRAKTGPQTKADHKNKKRLLNEILNRFIKHRLLMTGTETPGIISGHILSLQIMLYLYFYGILKGIIL